MITLRCCICNLELGQADAEVRITCPSCQGFKWYLFAWLADPANVYDNEGFDSVEWLKDVQKRVSGTNTIILAFSNVAEHSLDTVALNDDVKWRELCLLKEFEAE